MPLTAKTAFIIFILVFVGCVQVTLVSSLSVAADLPLNYGCDDEGLAICLDHVNEKATNGIKKCHKDNPHDNNRYLACRDTWREYADIFNDDCYERYCNMPAHGSN